MRPRQPAAQRQHAVHHRERFVGAQTEFGAGVGRGLAGIFSANSPPTPRLRSA
jgi:hypothetical protein